MNWEILIWQRIFYLYVHVCVFYTYACVCLYVCLYTGTCVYFVCMCLYMCILYACMYVCTCDCVCMYVCMFVCSYVCSCVCCKGLPDINCSNIHSSPNLWVWFAPPLLTSMCTLHSLPSLFVQQPLQTSTPRLCGCSCASKKMSARLPLVWRSHGVGVVWLVCSILWWRNMLTRPFLCVSSCSGLWM